jgi:hypothetical protein
MSPYLLVRHPIAASWSFFIFFIQSRVSLAKETSKRPGSQIQTSSFLKTDQPLTVKKDLILIGETWIGVHGKKYRFEEKGDKKATPRPPFVRASRNPWLAQAR